MYDQIVDACHRNCAPKPTMIAKPSFHINSARLWMPWNAQQNPAVSIMDETIPNVPPGRTIGRKIEIADTMQATTSMAFSMRMSTLILTGENRR
jgi:hypothetical protein